MWREANDNGEWFDDDYNSHGRGIPAKDVAKTVGRGVKAAATSRVVGAATGATAAGVFVGWGSVGLASGALAIGATGVGIPIAVTMLAGAAAGTGVASTLGSVLKKNRKKKRR